MSNVSSLRFIETLDPVVTELVRNFNLIADLDSRSKQIIDNINKDSSQFRQNKRSLVERMILYDKIKRSCNQMEDYCDDKIQLAQQTYDMIDKHVQRLDGELARINAEYCKRLKEAMANEEGGQQQQQQQHHHHHQQQQQQQVGVPNKKVPKKAKVEGRSQPSTSSGSASSISSPSESRSPSTAPQSQSSARCGNKRDSSGQQHASTKKQLSILSMMPKCLEEPAPPTNGAPAQEPTLTVDMPIDPNEPTYCVCHQVGHGEMVACDNSACPIEWFHFACVNLVESPKGQWYCPNCAPSFKNKPKKRQR